MREYHISGRSAKYIQYITLSLMVRERERGGGGVKKTDLEKYIGAGFKVKS